MNNTTALIAFFWDVTVIKNIKFITKPQIVVNLSDFDIQSCTKANDLSYL